MMITKGELQRLRTQNQKRGCEAHLTPSPVTMQQVDWQIERERLNAIKHREERLNHVQEALQENFDWKSREGLAKGQFNAKTQEQQISM